MKSTGDHSGLMLLVRLQVEQLINIRPAMRSDVISINCIGIIGNAYEEAGS